MYILNCGKCSSKSEALSILHIIYGTFLIMMATNAIIPVVRIELGFDYSVAEGDSLIQAIWLVIYLLGLIFIFINRKEFFRIFLKPKLLWIIYGLAFFSIIWSADPSVTFRRSIALFFTQIIGLYLYSRFKIEGLVRVLRYAFGISIVISFVFVIMFPNIGVHHDDSFDGAWRGIYVHKNSLGNYMVLSFSLWLISFIDFYNKLKIHGYINLIASFVFTLLSLVLVFRSESKTALTMVFVVLIVLIFRSVLRSNPRFAIAFMFSAITLIMLILFFGINKYEDIIVFMGKDITISGRTQIWQLTIDAILEKPIIGYGYGAFWQGFDGPSAYICGVLNFNVHHAHNGYLDLVLELGILGLIVYVLSVIILIFRLIGAQRYNVNCVEIFPLIFIMHTLLYNISETFMMAQNTISWILYTFIYIMSIDKINGSKNKSEVVLMEEFSCARTS